DAPSSPPAPPSRAPAPPPPSWQAQSTPVDDGGIELDLGGPPASEPVGTPVGRRGRSYDLSSLNDPSFPAAHEPELLAEDLLEPLEELEPEELEAELVPSAPPRTSDALALNVAAQSVADMLSDSLLVEGGTDDGYEVELLSVTASMPAWQAG